MKYIIVAFAILMSVQTASGQDSEQPIGEAETVVTDEQYALAVAEFMAELEPRKGRVDLAGAPVTVNVPEGLVYYSRADAKRILEDLWGNAPGYDQVGMIAQEGVDLTDPASWAAILSYEDTGYVSDADASDIDYDDLLQTLQRNTAEANRRNVEAGYDSQELIGWAAEPRYDPSAHRMFWAKEIVFAGLVDDATLNYDMRVLGRSGVLSLNFVASMPELETIERVAVDVLAAPSFNAGQTYTDYVEGDRTAGYGVAALIAGGAGAAALKKGGLIALLLVFLKKGWVLILVFGGIVLSGIKRLFGVKS